MGRCLLSLLQLQLTPSVPHRTIRTNRIESLQQIRLPMCIVWTMATHARLFVSKAGRAFRRTLYAGLILTEHVADGRRTTFKPRTDLKQLFPLQVGQRYRIDFDTQEPGGEHRLLRTEYKVVGRNQLAIGECEYEVLRIDYSNRYGDGPLTHTHTDLYAPEIKLVVGREFKQRDGTSEIQKYDSLSLIRAGSHSAEVKRRRDGVSLLEEEGAKDQPGDHPPGEAAPYASTQQDHRGNQAWQRPSIGVAESDASVVPGTKWKISVTKDRGKYVSCQISILSNSAEIRFAIGSKGSLVILLRDQFQENAVRDTLGWRDGQSYTASLFIDSGKPMVTSAQRIWKHTLVILLERLDIAAIFNTAHIAISIGGISMRGYDVTGLAAAREALYECYQSHGQGAAPLARSILINHVSELRRSELAIWNSRDGCLAEQCPILKFSCQNAQIKQFNPRYTLTVPYLNELARTKLIEGLNDALGARQRTAQDAASSSRLVAEFVIDGVLLRQMIDDFHFEFDAMNGWSVTIASSIEGFGEQGGIRVFVAKLAKAKRDFSISLFGVLLSTVEMTPEHTKNFRTFVSLCGEARK